MERTDRAESFSELVAQSEKEKEFFEFLLARMSYCLPNWLITVFAWDEIAHADTG